jgi:multidrug efflux pump subunit AcrA (membrane-fusion protein)
LDKQTTDVTHHETYIHYHAYRFEHALAACSAVQRSDPLSGADGGADSTIIAEGRLEPGRYAEIAFTASGRISDILVDEGQQVKQGDELIRLGDASDTQYAAAQLELSARRP